MTIHRMIRLHFPSCFNNGPYKVDELKKNVARLNTNIVTICLSQDISIDHNHFAHTLANLHKLVTSASYPHRYVFRLSFAENSSRIAAHRSVPVEYSKEYIALIAEQTMDTNEAYIFSPQLDEEDEELDLQYLDEWESLPHGKHTELLIALIDSL
jgi:hypothetical protein